MTRPGLPLLLVGIIVRLGPSAHAQENGPPSKGDAPAPVHRFFTRPVDYWQQGLTFESDKKPPAKESGPDASRSARPAGASDWSQAVRQPDGTLAYRELPRPLVEVLEDPNPEKIRAYFEWKLARTGKILRAAQAIKEYRSADPPPDAPGTDVDNLLKSSPPAEPSSPSRTLGGPKTPFTVTYFHRGGCPHCDHQDELLRGWLKDKPEGKLEVVEFGAKPELWRRYGVRGTPSLVIEDQASLRHVFLEGLAKDALLDQGLAQARLGPPEKMSPEENK
jgi:hypothetical protein